MEPVLLKDILPCAVLKEHVRKYQVFRFTFEKDVDPPVKFHTPRPEHSITFYIRDPQRFSHVHSGDISTYARCIVNGIYTVPLYRYGGHDFCAIKVVLQPTTLSRLRIMPVKELTDTYVNAEDCFGRQVHSLCEQLMELNDLDKMIGLIESFLIDLIEHRCRPQEPIDRVSQSILKLEGNTSLDWLASQSCLSVRQFIRRFEEHVGVSPKKLQRISRFERAIHLKNNNPCRDWLYIALACGYYDYQHLARDFKEFTELTPPEFYEIEKRSPERYFSLHEG